MLRQDTYQRLADTFGTGLAVAEWTEPFYPYYPVSKMPDDLKVIALTRFIIANGIYQPVIREVIRLENKYKNKRIKRSTIYEKAIDIIVEQNQIIIE
jgi:hypothetical protein